MIFAKITIQNHPNNYLSPSPEHNRNRWRSEVTLTLCGIFFRTRETSKLSKEKKRTSFKNWLLIFIFFFLFSFLDELSVIERVPHSSSSVWHSQRATQKNGNRFDSSFISKSSSIVQTHFAGFISIYRRRSVTSTRCCSCCSYTTTLIPFFMYF